MSYNNNYNNPYASGQRNPYSSSSTSQGHEGQQAQGYTTQSQPQQSYQTSAGYDNQGYQQNSQSYQQTSQGSRGYQQTSQSYQQGLPSQQASGYSNTGYQQTSSGQSGSGQGSAQNSYARNGGSGSAYQPPTYSSQKQQKSATATTAVAGGASNPYQSYELSGDRTDFFSQVQSIKDDLNDYNNLTDRLQKLQTKSLNAIGTDEISSIQNQIDTTSANLEDLQSNTIKPKLQQLYRSCNGDKDKQSQAENLKQQFRTSITRLAKIEDGYNQSNIQKAVDQYKIVNPSASDGQARDFVDESGDQQVFDNAIALSNRKGEAMTVLQEVQARHQEVERTEKMAAELNQLFSELQGLVFEQDQQFDSAVQNVTEAQDNLERGDANVIKARDKAKKSRKWKWILFWVCVILVLAIVGGIVGGIMGSRK